MAYNHGREDRKWRIWKEAEEKVLRECCVDEAVIEQIRIEDRADFNSNRRFYQWMVSVLKKLRQKQADREAEWKAHTADGSCGGYCNSTEYLTQEDNQHKTIRDDVG